MPAKIRTIQELRRELNAKVRSLAKLRAQRRRLATRTTALDRRIAAIEGGVPAVPKRRKAAKKRRKKVAKRAQRRRRSGVKPLAAHMADVLAGSKAGMRTGEVVKAVKKAGYKTKSKAFHGIVSATLRTPSFRRVKRGVYKLR